MLILKCPYCGVQADETELSLRPLTVVSSSLTAFSPLHSVCCLPQVISLNLIEKTFMKLGGNQAHPDETEAETEAALTTGRKFFCFDFGEEERKTGKREGRGRKMEKGRTRKWKRGKSGREDKIKEPAIN